jgi:DinB superfamily
MPAMKKKSTKKKTRAGSRKTAGRNAANRNTADRKSADQDLRKQLVDLLKGGQAHIGFRDALEDFPARKHGVLAKGLAHTAWQLLEHARIAQRDILEFSRNPEHVSPEFPEGYWPKTPIPPDAAAWDKSIHDFHYDLLQMIALVENPKTDLHAAIPRGHGKTILREVLVLADHTAYHLGQLVDLRRALGIWPEA